MRKILIPGFVSMLPLLAGAAGSVASSIISVGVPAHTPSLVSVGDVEAALVEAPAGAITAGDTDIIAIGNSIVAVGADAIPPSAERVASVTEQAAEALPEWMATDAPLPLRGND